MARTLYEYVSILDPHVDVDELAEARAIISQLGLDHPEWKRMHWTTRLTISTECASEFRITVKDPKGVEPWKLVWLGALAVLLILLYLIP